jgi:hypothetical protein
VWCRIVSPEERIVDLTTVDVSIIEAEQLLLLPQLIDLEFA